ncbi:hypothetical protein GcM1_161008 [Golovinomyces cichoracearum]|uniref:Uncharacterized protein n=1 Tax=Golovinomyces cichoracearum TaxID=62708 RepID=A0A420J8Y5_9PEZI|nr:hypothetical protein GcM1_161008 [Golovinomyces cichoracearum]
MSEIDRATLDKEHIIESMQPGGTFFQDPADYYNRVGKDGRQYREKCQLLSAHIVAYLLAPTNQAKLISVKEQTTAHKLIIYRHDGDCYELIANLISSVWKVLMWYIANLLLKLGPRSFVCGATSSQAKNLFLLATSTNCGSMTVRNLLIKEPRLN